MSTRETVAYPSGGSVRSTRAGLASQSKLRANSGRLRSPHAAKSEQPNGLGGAASVPTVGS